MPGRHYPSSAGEFQSWFATDADCLDYLEWLRWPDGFACPACGGSGWQLGDGRFECAGCGLADLGDSGHDLRPDADAADGLVHGVLAVRDPEGRRLGAEPAARAGHRLLPDRLGDARPATLGAGAPGPGPAGRPVEVDETFIGGEEPGLRGGRARGKKSLVGIAAEVREPKGIGRCRMAILQDAPAAALRPFITGHIAPGAGRPRPHRCVAGLSRAGQPRLYA